MAGDFARVLPKLHDSTWYGAQSVHTVVYIRPFLIRNFDLLDYEPRLSENNILYR